MPQKKPVSFEPVLSDSDLQRMDKVRKDVERTKLILEHAEIQTMLRTCEKRREFTKTIPKFWGVALMRNSIVSMELGHKEDQEAIQCLEDIWVERNPVEPRAYTIVFTFSRNRFFTDRVLKKEYKFTESQARKNERPDKDGFKWTMLDFDWERDVEPQPYRISWNRGQNLCELYPKVEEDGDVTELGSFFNWFESPGDIFDFGVIIADDIFPDAINYFTGDISEDEDEDEDDGSDDAGDNSNDRSHGYSDGYGQRGGYNPGGGRGW